MQPDDIRSELLSPPNIPSPLLGLLFTSTWFRLLLASNNLNAFGITFATYYCLTTFHVLTLKGNVASTPSVDDVMASCLLVEGIGS